MGIVKTFHGVLLGRLAFFGSLILRVSEPALWVLWCVYLFAFLGLLLDNIWYLRFLIIPPLLIFLFTAPFALYNFGAFVLRAPLYQDSPATIIVVAITGLFATLPSAIVLYTYWQQRKHIFGLP